MVNGLTWRAWDACGTRGARGAWDAWGAWVRGSVARVRACVGAWHVESVRARGSAWERVGTRGARGGAWQDLWRRVGARGAVSGEPETSGGAWGRVRGQIRPILVSMDRS